MQGRRGSLGTAGFGVPRRCAALCGKAVEVRKASVERTGGEEGSQGEVRLFGRGGERKATQSR